MDMYQPGVYHKYVYFGSTRGCIDIKLVSDDLINMKQSDTPVIIIMSKLWMLINAYDNA